MAGGGWRASDACFSQPREKDFNKEIRTDSFSMYFYLFSSLLIVWRGENTSSDQREA
jgi:hypothetical protein